LGGAVDHNDNPNIGNPSYVAALSNLDADMPQCISDNTDDEISHAAFINAYLESKGEAPVSFTAFQTLPPSKATGANQNLMRITNLDFNNSTNQQNANLSATDQAAGSQMFQTNLVLPEPTEFLRKDCLRYTSFGRL
jgi:hypothetical protein